MTAVATIQPTYEPAHATARPASGTMLLIFLCLIGGMFGRLCYLTRPFNSDAGMFIYMGKVMNEGGRLGVDFCDNKFPTVGLITGIFWRAFGTGWAGYVLVQTAMVLVAVGMLSRAMRRHAGESAALATGLFALVLLNFSTIVFGGFQLETMQGFFAVLAAGAGIEGLSRQRSRCFLLAGIFAGCAAMLKPTGLAVAGAIMLTIVFNRQRSRLQIAALVAGVLISLCIAAACLFVTGQLEKLPLLWNQITRYAADSAWEPADVYKLIVVGGLLFFPVLVRLWIFRRDREPMQSPRFLMIFATLWLLLELTGVILQKRMYAYHFLVLIPPVALLFGLIPRRARATSLAAGLGPVLALSVLGACRVTNWDHPGRQVHPVSQYLLSHANPTDAIWREDGARILLETNLHSGSRYPLTFLFTNYDQAPLDYGRTILSDFHRTQPKYIILFTNFESWIHHQCDYYTELRRRPVRRENYLQAWRAIRAYVDENYVEEATVSDETIFRRK